MTPERKTEIELRWQAIDNTLSDIDAGKTLPGVDDIAALEESLLEEQEGLEYELGEAYFQDRDKENS